MIAAPSIVAARERTPKGGPPANHSSRPRQLSKPAGRSALPFTGTRTIAASSCPPPKIIPSMDMIDCKLISDLATFVHVPLGSRLQISRSSTTARQLPSTSDDIAENFRPVSSVSLSPISLNTRHPEDVATRTVAIDAHLTEKIVELPGVVSNVFPCHGYVKMAFSAGSSSCMI